MADYERRLQRLEDRAAADSSDERDDALLEAVRKRTAELLSSPEVLSLKLPDVPEEDWAPMREELLAAARWEMRKS